MYLFGKPKDASAQKQIQILAGQKPGKNEKQKWKKQIVIKHSGKVKMHKCMQRPGIAAAGTIESCIKINRARNKQYLLCNRVECIYVE